MVHNICNANILPSLRLPHCRGPYKTWKVPDDILVDVLNSGPHVDDRLDDQVQRVVGVGDVAEEGRGARAGPGVGIERLRKESFELFASTPNGICSIFHTGLGLRPLGF